MEQMLSLCVGGWSGPNGPVINCGERGYKTGMGEGGGQLKFYPYQKKRGGAETALAMLKGGHKQF